MNFDRLRVGWSPKRTGALVEKRCKRIGIPFGGDAGTEPFRNGTGRLIKGVIDIAIILRCHPVSRAVTCPQAVSAEPEEEDAG